MDDAGSGARYLIRWDGRDASGLPVSPGVYLMRVMMINNAGKIVKNDIYKFGRR